MGDVIDMENLKKHMAKPKLFAASTAPFWDDPHISQQMLKAHLDPNGELASRKHETIDRSVEWIVRKLCLKKGNRILDLGCGPGLYCTRFAERGFIVTGIDYSKRSIQYAKDYAASNKLDIEYCHKDYLTIDYNNIFDLVTLIYYDFGVLSDQDCASLLGKVYRSMKPGGHFVFDVHTPTYHDSIREEKTWTFKDKGFWRPIPYLLLTENIKYPTQSVLLTQYMVMDGNSEVDVYRIWDRAFLKETISKILLDSGFCDIKVYEDLTGKTYSKKLQTMGIIAEK